MISASAQVVERALDEARRPEHGRVDLHPGEARRQLVAAPPRRRGSPPSVFAPGNFSTTSSSASSVAAAATASPISGWWSSTTVATSPSRSRPRAALDRHLGEVVRRPRSAGCAGPGAAGWASSMKPPVPGVDASRKLSGETSCALPAVRDDLLAASRGVAAALAGRPAPAAAGRAGPRSRRSRRRGRPSAAAGSSSARAPTARSGVSFCDESAIIITRLVDDSGCSICGGCRRSGARAPGSSRSCTSWRARRTSVPGSKSIMIDDRPGTDSERIVSTPSTPLSRSCSSGTVMSCSTSSADRPSASVWTST